MWVFIQGPLKNSVRSFPLICDIPILRKSPVRLALTGVNYREPTPGFCFSGRIAQGLSQKGKIGAELQPNRPGR